MIDKYPMVVSRAVVVDILWLEAVQAGIFSSCTMAALALHISQTWSRERALSPAPSISLK